MATDLIASSPPLPQHELYFHNHSSIAVAATPDMSRRGPPSVASDSTSVVSSLAAAGIPPYLTSINPKPDYVSQDSASRITTELYRAQRDLDSEDEDSNTREPDSLEVTDGATQYVNSFLDKLLHDILSVANTTQLAQLRTATGKTLRKSLGVEAVQYADANLEDLLALEDEEEEQRPISKDSNSKWNLEYTWKRSRLRVMMRSEKSEFDIDDDERWVQQEALIPPGRRFSENTAIISLQSEIFLAGVLDYVADTLFNLAIIPASIRMRRGSKRSPAQQSNPNILVIEEPDLEKGVLNSPLDKLWRMWRKSQRPRGFAGTPRHGHSYSNVSSPATTRRESDVWGDGPYHDASQDLQTPRGMPGEFIETPAVEYNQRDVVPDADDHPEHVIASNIPLPQGQRDVDEIEVPGLARDPDEYEEELVEEPRRASYNPPSRKTRQSEQTEDGAQRPGMQRRRSISAPPPFAARDFAPNKNANISEIPAEPSANEISSLPAPENTFSLKREEGPAGDSSEQGTKVESTGKVVVDSQPREDTGPSSGKIAAGIGAAAAVGAVGTAAAASRWTDRNDQSPEREDHSPTDGSPRGNRRNREAAVGFGYPNGISLPGQTATGEVYKHKHMSVASSAASEPEVPPKDVSNPPSERSPSELSKLRAGSPGSETETSEIMSPRDFMASRNLQYTRSTRSDSLPEHPMNPLGSNKPPPAPRSRGAYDFSRKGDSSPVSPISPVDNGLGSIDEAGKLPNIDREQKPTHRKTSAPAGRLQDDLARARGSPKVRQASLQSDYNQGDSSPVHRKESLRRIAVERNGSLVSLVDENTHKVRNKAPITSSSITSAEDFDSLLNGGETIKMTLSPSSVREVPSAPPSRNGSVDHNALAKLSGGSSPRIGNLLQRKQGDDGSIKSPSIGSSDKSNRGRTGSTATQDSRRSISRPSVRNKSKTRAGLMAREPTVQTDSTRDFADFIRSTGPDREPRTLVPALTNRTSEVADAQRASSISGRSISGLGRSEEMAPAMPQVSENAGIKYKRSLAPREARGSEPTGNDGLIDFIRTGPGSGKQDARPSKDIAPFRYSMDSDDMRLPVETINLDDPTRNPSMTPSMANGSYDHHRGSVSTMATMQTMNTYNSHAPLVSNRGGTSISSPISLGGNTTPKLNTQPKKSRTTKNSDGVTRYRNKDPYAIDISDEDDDDEEEEDLGPRIPQLPPNPPPSPPQPQASTTGVPSANAGPNAIAPNRSVVTKTASGGIIPRNPNRNRAPADDGMARRKETSTRDLADFFRDSAPPGDGPVGGKAAAMMGGGGGGPGGAGAGGRYVAGKDQLFGGAAPSPNIGNGAEGKRGEEKKGKFWSRKRYLDLP
ncbi:hypothetical protein BDZ85DRAFT_280638 [Elsinoe ampelina]|uniref:Uncharacterized protein n=1 Tax=Elsinoe ampelina TaxID=302913 RepID=A0A6A6GEH1_9PEZI|nr:hypothetical protein BDZ85DRAFT_280638 [Elsinoe ampelina]